MRQEGTIFHTTALRERPPVHQQANKSITRRGITQDNPKRLKMVFHKAQQSHNEEEDDPQTPHAFYTYNIC
jgi:hypothetical protein